METHNLELTTDELLAELLSEIGIEKLPRFEDGWRSVPQMAEASGETPEYVRSRAEKKYKLGLVERCIYKKSHYYRTKP
jgi:hypothetical protein